MKKKRESSIKNARPASETLALADTKQINEDSKTTIPTEKAVRYMRNWSMENKK